MCSDVQKSNIISLYHYMNTIHFDNTAEYSKVTYKVGQLNIPLTHKYNKPIYVYKYKKTTRITD